MERGPEPESGLTTIRELIDQRAKAQPDGVFLISPETGGTLSFHGLREQARLLCARLRGEGLEPGDKIAFLMDNGLFTAQLFLGAIYGGFVAVPLNVRAGASQLSYTLDHCDARVVFVEEKYDALVKEALASVRHEVRVIAADVDSFAAESGATLAVAPPSVCAAGDVALLMYTSGSTGQPKAAIHTHGTILAQARNSVLSHQLTAADRSLLVLPLYHINAECVTLVPTLLSGGCVVVPHHFVVSQFWDWIDEHRCTWTALVPTIISQLLDWKDPRAESRAEAFRRLRFLRSSSAPLSPSLHREFLDKFKLPLIQAMGCSEGGNVFSNPVPPGVNKIGSPGLPWGFEARIVNHEGADVPVGEPGEVLLRGPAMMLGYYKDPVGTAAALDTEGWLHTGDLAYRDADGYFFVVGRSKELIIKGGTNIAPKQIDEVLESHPSVLEAAAVGVPDRYVGEDLVAFAVLREGMKCDEKELLGFCESRLGHFKTPTRIHFVDDLPKGPSGKVQRLRLVEEASKPGVARSVSLGGEAKKPAAEGTGAPLGPVATEAEIEQGITEVWSDLLGKPQIDAQSNFFALGGHSLLAIQCLSRLREKLSVILSLTEFFENATVAHLAAVVRQKLSTSPEERSADGEQPVDDSQPIPMRDRHLPCPLSPAQQRIWFVEQLAPEALAYNEAEAVRLTGDLHVDALERAFNIIVGRHELLRSTIRVTGDQPFFVIHEKWPLEFKRIDLSALPAAEREAEVERLVASEPRRPYYLEKSPGIRTSLLRLGPQEHVFILMMHHIICDWSSEGVMWRELSALYRAILRGEPLVLPPLPIQHGDYAAWQQQQYVPENYAKGLAFWKKTLRDAPALMELPTDRPRPPISSYQGARKRFRIGPAQTEALRQLGRREKTSLFTVFAAALNALLHRYNRSEDIVLGIPLADRDRAELQSMIGFLLHTQVLRTAVEENISFSALLGRVQKATLDMFIHRAVPFDLIVREVGHERTLSHSPLFQVMLNWRDRDQELSFIGLEGLKIESLLAASGTSKFDMGLQVTDNGDEISLEVDYSTDLFDEARIVRMVDHYQTLLAAVVADPDRKLSELPLLTEAERRRILVEWNRTEQAFPRDTCIHELFEQQVERTPDAVAAVFGNQRLTYRELNAKANQLARHLQKLGVAPETRVGICAERSLEMVIGLLGILKAGGAYVPMDPKYPKDRLAFMMEDAEVPVLLTQAHLAASLPISSARIVRLDADWPAVAKESPDQVPSPVQARHLAYMIYTSGSTGKPKGVLLEHRGLCNLVMAQIDEFQIHPGSRVLQFASMSFDASVSEIFSALVIGATLYLAESDKLLPGPELRTLLRDEAINVVTFPPTVLNALSEANLPALRTVVSAGEACTLELAHRWGRNRRFINAYGPTEGTVCATMKVIAPSDTKLTIGRAMANVQIYILDRQLQPVPVGVAGELHIGGGGLARGYHNRPELTAEKFIAHPFSTDPTARLYKTGDLARFLPDGDIEYLGRLDHQIKIRGFRVELGEIEEVLNQHPEVQTSVVVAREDTPGDKRLIAYVVSRKGAARSSVLRESLLGKLPDYMAPAAFVLLDALPLTSSGKVDRKALPRPDFEAVVDKSKSAVPGTPTETALAEIWCEVLGLKQVGIHDDFFELGGHSILAVKLVGKISKSLNYYLSIPVFFRNPTIGKLAMVIDQENHVDHESGSVRNNGHDAPLVTFQAKGDRPAFFFLHGDWLGGGLYCGRLAKFLGEDQPLHVLPPYRSGKPTAVTVEEMAAYQIAAMQAHTPRGPYLLGGYCIGAMVAMEMARQLLKKGEQVPHLLLVDPSPIGSQMLRDFWPIVDRVGQVMKWDLEKKIHFFDHYGVAFCRWSEKSPGSKFMALRNRLGLAPRNGSSPVTAEPADGNIEILNSLDYAIYVLAYRLYNLKSLAVPVTVYFPEQTPEARLAWVDDAQKIFPKVTVEMVPGNHRSCVIEHTSALVDKMKKTLDELSAVYA